MCVCLSSNGGSPGLETDHSFAKVDFSSQFGINYRQFLLLFDKKDVLVKF